MGGGALLISGGALLISGGALLISGGAPLVSGEALLVSGGAPLVSGEAFLISGEAPVVVLLWCAFALACGGLIKGALGVGTPLLTVPLMALVLPPQSAVALMAVPVVVANLWQAWQAPRVDRVVGRFWPAFAAILAGSWIGVAVLTHLEDKALLIIVGAAVIVFALLQGSGHKLRIPDRLEKPAGVGFGFASGVIGGISSFFGPMLIIYLVSLPNLDKERFIGAISFLYISAVLPWAITLYWVGILNGALLLYSGAAVIPVVLGMLIGRSLRKFISEHRFRHLILVILLCSGGITLGRAVW